MDMFRESGLMKKMKDNGKVCIADRGFQSKKANERRLFAYPDYMDSKELGNFKTRARLRQETFNRRLKHFEALSLQRSKMDSLSMESLRGLLLCLFNTKWTMAPHFSVSILLVE